VFWGFIASVYVGNLMLLALNLPLVGLFVTVLRIPYVYLYPLIIMFCIIGVYEVSHAMLDVWIMLIMGAMGYFWRKFDFDPPRSCSASSSRRPSSSACVSRW
jgi:putative tricarboxylic transport membrane protein